MKRFQRILALLLTLALCLPWAAQADEQAHGLRMDLTFQLDASAYPDDMQEVLPGLADALQLLTLRGDLCWRGNLFSQDTAFDSDAALTFGEDAEVPFHLYGVPSHIMVESPLLGDQQVMLNMLAWLEFAVKANFQLGIPLYQVAPYVSTYANASAFDAFLPAWNETMQAEEGSRTVDAEAVVELASVLMETAQEDRAFTYWLQALLMDSGMDEMVQEGLSMLPEWVESFLEEDGLTIEVDEDTETWSAGEEQLFYRDASSWELTLPMTDEGYTASASWVQEEDGFTFRLCFGMEDEADVLDFTVALTGLPTAEAEEGQAIFMVDRTGEMLGDTHMRWQADWSRETDAEDGTVYQVRAAQVNTETDAEMLVISGTLTSYTPAEAPQYTAAELAERGVNLFSVYEDTLSDFVHQVALPFAKGILPVLEVLPASSYQSAFVLLEQFHLLDLLSSSL